MKEFNAIKVSVFQAHCLLDKAVEKLPDMGNKFASNAKILCLFRFILLLALFERVGKLEQTPVVLQHGIDYLRQENQSLRQDNMKLTDRITKFEALLEAIRSNINSG